MLRIKPFEAIRPPVEIVSRLAALPYDVMDTHEARQMADGNPDCFLRISRPELELPDDTDPYSDAVYRRASDNLLAFLDRGSLQRDDTPRLFLYRQSATLLGKERTQTGLVCCCHVDDYNNNLIKKHEKTRRAKEDDRTRHVLETNVNSGPVFLMFKDNPDIAGLMQQAVANPPLYDFTAPDGVRHTVWPIENPQPFIDAFATIPAAYVADGHHRAASAARAAATRASQNPNHSGNEEYNWFLSVLFPASHLTILPYHRIVTELNNLTPDQFLARLRDIAPLTELDHTQNHLPQATGTICIYNDKRWFSLTFPPDSINHADAVASLDYQILSDRILDPILGISDLRTDPRIDFVGGIRGPEELRKRVDAGHAAAAFAMAPVRIDQIMSVADAGQIMPPKSTWFEPKLRSGLLVHALD
ncbi:MAG: DUF1015 domain-containing protein [Phycisphaeraceae bacterium]|nr:MAG: DUF1015 domain-containing protein [Phycisphaeraceae bacterium]